MTPRPKRRKMTRSCVHANTETAFTGGMHFSGGEVWDDIHEYVVCLDCGREVHLERKPAVFTGRGGVVLGFRDMVTDFYCKGGEFAEIPF